MIHYQRMHQAHICVLPGIAFEANIFNRHVLECKPKLRPADIHGTNGYWYQLPNMELHIGIAQEIRNATRHFAMQAADEQAACLQLGKTIFK